MRIINYNARNNLSYSIKHIITNYNLLSISVAALFSLSKSESGIDRLLNITELESVIDNIIGTEKFWDSQIPKEVGEFLVSGDAYSPTTDSIFGVSVKVGGISKVLIKDSLQTKHVHGFEPYSLNSPERILPAAIDFKQKVIMLPPDITMEYFNTAPEDQRLSGFFHGNEKIVIKNMHPNLPTIITSMPNLRLRMFVVHKNHYGEGIFKEMFIQTDTLWLLPNLEYGIILYRALYPVDHLEINKVKYVYSVMEDLEDEPKPIEDYLPFLFEQIKSIECPDVGEQPKVKTNITDYSLVKGADTELLEEAIMENFKDVWVNDLQLEQNLRSKVQILKNIRQQLEQLQQQAGLINKK